MNDSEINEALGELDSILDELLKIYETLWSDVMVSRDMVKGKDSPFWRRSLVRSLFAGIEGTSHGMKKLATGMAKVTSIELSRGEQALLKEESYDLNDKGEVTTTKSKIRTSENLLFSLKIVAYVCGSPYHIDKNVAGWVAFKDAQKIRDRITHPKNSEEVIISDREIEAIWETMNWYAELVNDVAEICKKTLLALKGDTQSSNSFDHAAN